jgi:hypothetical protein
MVSRVPQEERNENEKIKETKGREETHQAR